MMSRMTMAMMVAMLTMAMMIMMMMATITMTMMWRRKADENEIVKTGTDNNPVAPAPRVGNNFVMSSLGLS